MNSHLLRPGILLIAALVFSITFAATAQVYLYQLEPGSTITPAYFATPSGPTEPLTGTFAWTHVSYDAYWTTHNFNTSALNFQSASIFLTRHSSPYNGGTSSSGPWAYFDVVVNATGGGLSSPLQFVAWPVNDGSYEGDPAMPSRLIFHNERLMPVNGGGNGALLSFTAVLVPEPGGLAFLTLGIGVLLVGRRWLATIRAILLAAVFLCPALLPAQIYVGSGNFQGIVGKYTTSGVPINRTLITGLSEPYGMTLDQFENLYISDYLHGTVGKYTSSGAVINANLFSYGRPTGLAYDGQGRIYAASSTGMVGVFSTDGTPINLSLITTGLFNPDGLAYYDGKLYVLDAWNIYIYSTSGTLLADIPASTPWGISFDQNGHMFVPRQGYGAVALYTSSGTLLNPNLITGLNYPFTTALDAEGYLYVGEFNNGDGKVGKYTTSGTPINPSLITGLTSFSAMVIVPEPSALALGLLAAGMAVCTSAIKRRS